MSATGHVALSLKVKIGKGDEPRYRGRCSCGGFTTYQHYSLPSVAEQAVRHVHIEPIEQRSNA